MTVAWSDLYDTDNQPVVTLDDAEQSLLDLVPAEMRDQAMLVLRPQLAMIRMQLGDEKYAQFVEDVKKAKQHHDAGEYGKAQILFQHYGWGELYTQLLLTVPGVRWSDPPVCVCALPEVGHDGQSHPFMRAAI